MKYDTYRMDNMVKELFKEERSLTRLDGWFILRKKMLEYQNANKEENEEILTAKSLYEAIKILPISISNNAIFVGTQRDAFAQSYALINPNFKVSTFNGYCDPTAVFNDIEPNDEFSKERIEKVKHQFEETDYVTNLKKVYSECEMDTNEVIYFVEQVSGHLIPDFRYVLKYGTHKLVEKINKKIELESDITKIYNYKAMIISLSCVDLLCFRYIELSKSMLNNADDIRKEELNRIINTLSSITQNGATNLYEAIQLFMLLWEVMCLEQAPNPFAFSVGNADRIFNPYYEKENITRKEASSLFKHLLLFFNVGSRSWAISQNIIIGGKDINGKDLTNKATYALLDAYYECNFPQPILSVKFHKNTPIELYEDLGRFFFTPGVLTPSMFNDDMLFPLIKNNGVEENDLPDISIAGCQEPLIMGKDNANTTNSWLSLPKILEITLNNGISLISNKKIAREVNYKSKEELLTNIRDYFYDNVDYYVDRMVNAANGAAKAISYLRVPFLSAFMGGVESGYDTRDIYHQGTKYNGSGCLIHGLSVIADSFIAIDNLLKSYENKEELFEALKDNYEGHDNLYRFLKSQPKYGNNIRSVDDEARIIAKKVANIVRSKKNYLNNPFRPDYSSPTTHLLYGYWVGATPNGRKSREMLNYGIDPLYGKAENGLGYRILSMFNLDYLDFNGGYASHIGLDPKYFKGNTTKEKGIEFRNKVINPLFFSNDNNSPFYLYVNVTTPEILRKVLAHPEIYAPSGVYIMRIHGTFVNFLDLSKDVQEDIIKRLDLSSTCLC